MKKRFRVLKKEVRAIYVVKHDELVAEWIVLEAVLEALGALDIAALLLGVKTEEQAHRVEDDCRIVDEHVAVNVHHECSIGYYSRYPGLSSREVSVSKLCSLFETLSSLTEEITRTFMAPPLK